MPTKLDSLLAVDYGKRKCGVAVSSEGVAFPLETVPTEVVLARVADLVRDRRVTHVLVGHPLGMDGRASPETRAAESFAGRLRKAVDPVATSLWDERLSTYEAGLALDLLGDRSREDDAIAASIVLQNYIDSLSNACTSHS